MVNQARNRHLKRVGYDTRLSEYRWLKYMTMYGNWAKHEIRRVEQWRNRWMPVSTMID